ncbi:MAG TPA: EAL domain-containing protein [Gammaproteobacteria bacterium]|nr:EAL domain-containing protein [Gammaproteobacteria bacterium]
MAKSSNGRSAAPRRPRALLRGSARLGFRRDADPTLALVSIVCRVAAAQLGVDRAAVLRPTRDAARYVMYAGYGWTDRGSVERLVDAGQGSLVARTLASDRPVVIGDPGGKDTDPGDAWLQDAGPGTAALVDVGDQPAPSAVLAVFRSEHRRWSSADLRRLQVAARFARLVFDQRTTREVLEHVWTMLDSTSDFIGTTDASGRDRYLNKAARELFGLETSADVYRFRLGDAYPPDQYRYMKEHAYPAARRDGIWRGETVLLRHDGTRVPVSQVTVVQKDARGRTLYMSTTARDITDEKRARAEQAARLARTERQRQAILHIATSAAATGDDRERALTEVCRAAAQAMQIPYVCIWELTGNGDQDELRCIAANRPAMPAFFRPGAVRRARSYPRYFEALRSERALAITDALSDRRTREFERDYLEPVEIRSILDAPIRVGGRIVGMIGHKHTGAPRAWTVDETDFCAQLADQVAQVLLRIDREQARKALEQSEQRYRVLYDQNPAMFFTLDPTGRILSVNRFGAGHLGYTVDYLLGRNLAELEVGAEREGLAGELETCLAQPGRYHRWENCLARPDGSLVWVSTTARVVPGPGRASELLLVCEDHTETYRLSEKLSHQASHDQLTGLYNRRWLEREIERLLEDVRDNDSAHALCYLDLDNFKVINETCGHAAGDDLLRRLAQLMQQHAGPGDSLARLGGDEFGVLLAHRTIDEAEHVAERLRDAVRDFRFRWQDSLFMVGVSIGLVPITRASGELSQIFRDVDAACFAAKDEGRNRVHVYRADDQQLARRYGEMQWVSRLRQALEEDRFELHWQWIAPLQEADAGGHHYELLVRMLGDDGALVQPDEFLPAAERYNLAPELDRWVVDHALDWLGRNPAHLEELGLCAINLSGQSLGDHDFLAFLQQRLREGRVPPRKICLEITETAAIGDLYTAVRFMDALRTLGVRFALDDFGSGLSSFAYLRSLPVDYLKIDGVFVKDIADDPIDLAVVKSINEIGKVMGKRTIAEFAENENILRRLREIGVDYAQGYGVGMPRPLHELSAAGGARPTGSPPG